MMMMMMMMIKLYCFFYAFGYVLDLLTTNTPYNKPKVSLKLHELEYKLDVEKKVLDGTKTLADALDRQPVQSDRKQRDEIKSQMYESIEKLGLLNRALRKYKGLYIGEGEEEDEDYGKWEKKEEIGRTELYYRKMLRLAFFCGMTV